MGKVYDEVTQKKKYNYQRCSISFVVREIESKIIKHHFTLITVLKFFKFYDSK